VTESSTHHVPGWERPPWATHSKDADGGGVLWLRDASTSTTYAEDLGWEASAFVPTLFRHDVVTTTGDGVAVTIGPVRIRFSDSGTATVAEARKLAEALTELADYADGTR
jgi:hypothetical protein